MITISITMSGRPGSGSLVIIVLLIFSWTPDGGPHIGPANKAHQCNGGTPDHYYRGGAHRNVEIKISTIA